MYENIQLNACLFVCFTHQFVVRSEEIFELFLVCVKITLHHFLTRAQQSFKTRHIQNWRKEIAKQKKY